MKFVSLMSICYLFGSSYSIKIKFNDLVDDADVEINEGIDEKAKETKQLLNDFNSKYVLAEKNIKLGDVGRGHTQDGIQEMKEDANKIAENLEA